MNNFSIDSQLESLYTQYPENRKCPVIGITTNSGGEDYALRQRYCEQVVKAGGVPMLLTPISQDIAEDKALSIMAQQLDLVDAVIFTGGGDHNPLWMGEQPAPQLHSINPERDSHELPLCRLAYNRHLPMLGICRGMQTIAIALGGHVAQDISLIRYPDHYRADKDLNVQHGTVKHSQDAPKNEPTHVITLKEHSTLFNLYKPHNGRIKVNSFHHQAVDDCGERFRPVAASADGVIEAMESTEFRQIMGVQWHPEQMGDDGLPVFEWLVKHATTFSSAKQLHGQMLTIDSHCDTPMFFSQGIDFLHRDHRILYDLHKMDEGRIDAVQMVCYLPQPKIGEKFSDKVSKPVVTASGTAKPSAYNEATGFTPLSYTDHIFDCIEDICNRSQELLPLGVKGGCAIARTPAEIARDKREGRHSIVLGIENGLALEHDLRNIQHFKQRGVTYITLCHNGDNDICDSARGCNTHGGLSSFGRKVIAEMNRQGIMVDLSHAAESSFYQALELSQTPIVCSHSNCRALCDHPRNLTDDQMRALAAKGGVMQLTLYHGFLVKDSRQSIRQAEQTGSGSVGKGREATIADFIEHLEHAISIMGIDHVGIGTDFDGDGGINGLADAAELINITEHLLRRGYSSNDIAKIWGRNWLRVMARCQSMG